MLDLFAPFSIGIFNAADLGSWAAAGYVGPGAGLSMLGALLAVVLVLLFALLAPFLYILRMARTFLGRRQSSRPVCLDAPGGRVGEE